MGYDIEKLVCDVVSRIREEQATFVPTAAPVPKREVPKAMNLALARRLIEKVREKADRMGVRSVVAVFDGGANPVSVDCSDGAYIASYDIAINKAYTSVSLNMPTAKLATLAAPGGPLYGIQNTNGGRIVIFGGGDPLYLDGQIVGAIGVSGGSAEEDTALSAYGAAVFAEMVR